MSRIHTKDLRELFEVLHWLCSTGQSVAGRSVAGESVAGRNVAERSVAGRSIAGRSVQRTKCRRLKCTAYETTQKLLWSLADRFYVLSAICIGLVVAIEYHVLIRT